MTEASQPDDEIQLPLWGAETLYTEATCPGPVPLPQTRLISWRADLTALDATPGTPLQGHIAITWQSHGNHMAITWQSHGNHVVIT